MSYQTPCSICGKIRVTGWPCKSYHHRCEDCAHKMSAAIDAANIDALVSSGRRGPSTRAERQQAAVRLAQRGMSTSRIADRLRLTERSVQRLLARNRAENEVAP